MRAVFEQLPDGFGLPVGLAVIKHERYDRLKPLLSAAGLLVQKQQDIQPDLYGGVLLRLRLMLEEQGEVKMLFFLSFEAAAVNDIRIEEFEVGPQCPAAPLLQALQIGYCCDFWVEILQIFLGYRPVAHYLPEEAVVGLKHLLFLAHRGFYN